MGSRRLRGTIADTSQRKSKRPPQFAKVGMLVSALIEVSAPICIERWEDYKMLGRFTLRDEGELPSMYLT